MDIVPAKSAAGLPDSFQRALCTLIDTVGTSEFVGALFHALRDMTGCEQMVVFSHSRGSPPRTLLSQNSGLVTNFSLRNEHYVSAFWHHDPVHRLDDEAASDDLYLARLDARDLASRSYREECFTDVGLGSRVSVIRTVAERVMRLNIYMRGRGAYEPYVAEQMLTTADVIDRLLRRHDSQAQRHSQRLGQNEIRDRLSIVAPALTPRELEVCTQIARGLTSEGIALELGISRNTVLTYRKRAYARLKITAQNELMQMLMS
jgi:DNA-binding CsgD family transcriptional regulator